ncbi:glycoside hydrolase family 30 protein [Nubsella zeaxanthinifaciens]|uniref:glycoside hydrolase family 30 protein n=1 Tax=Nubsella zeaxanthinifaciens TaxID=392412 RepID=UPI000DE1DF5E|nr:glycoside hydrolase family 30 beta sandwich domain-containing protein [Nubsella zeaxanthinifaciens]
MVFKPKFNFTVIAGMLTLMMACGKSAPAPDVVTPEIPDPNAPSDVAFYMTTIDKTSLFRKQAQVMNFGTVNNSFPTITVDESQTYQTMDGFGYTLTGGSASLINAMGAAEQAALLKELFSTDGDGIGVSYLRVSIGASDLSASTFTYNDLSSGQTDVNLANFNINPDKTDLIPVLKKILAINPNIKILGSPWSAPVWMKTNTSFIGGKLKPEHYATYAQYFVKYIQAMKAEGITIDAITIQNEPLNPYNNPSMVMEAAEQASFIKNNLGPAFRTANISTKIVLYDHNADRPDYPISILNDNAVKAFVDGSAFHLYGGSIDRLSEVHTAHPDKAIYFTEQWVQSPGPFPGNLQWHMENLIIGAPRNWSRNVLEWNLAADPSNNPHTPGGCTECLGAITINGSSVTRNIAYYVIAHASKFVRPGAVRIASNTPSNLPNVAFKNADGKKVLIVQNKSTDDQSFNIKFNNKTVTSTIKANAAGTYVW